MPGTTSFDTFTKPGLVSTRITRLIAFSAYLYGALIAVAWLWVLNASRYLRPSADDYCIGVRGDLGIFGGFVNDFQTFSGFATPSFLTNAFLGVPLARLPLSVALAIPFLLAALAVAGAALALAWSSITGLERRTRWIAVLLALPAVMVLWWAYLWSTYSPSGRPEPTDVALGLTHWQNLNTGYVIPIALVVILGVWIVRGRFQTWYTGVGAAVLLGLVAGFAGPATAIAVLLVAPVLALGLWVMGDGLWWVKGLVTWITTAGSLAVSLLAPGTRNRSSAARSDAEVTLGSLPGWFAAVVPDGFIAWFSLYWQWRSILVIGTGLVVVYALRLVFGRSIIAGSAPTWLAVTIFALALSASTIVTDTLAYGAYWHQSNTTVLTFLSLLLVGIGLGGWVPLPAPRLAILLLPLLLVALALTSLASVLDMSVSITDRFAAWQEGPAPIPGAIEDREVEWIGGCWEQLEQIRQGG
jgi:hypothetical protein